MYSENLSSVVLASAVRAATNDSGKLINRFNRAVDVIIDMTAVPGVQTVTFTIEGYDRASDKWYTILASTAIVATGTTVLRVGPALTAAANSVANAFLPVGWRVKATHSGAGNFTYSVGANLIG